MWSIPLIALTTALAVDQVDDRPLYFRGTQRKEMMGQHGVLSFTDSLPAALIWSAHPGDTWASDRAKSKARFLPTSTVSAVHLPIKKPLRFDDNSIDLSSLLNALRYGKPEGITEEEVMKIYNYLHNRLVGKARGGEFLYRVCDEEGHEIDDDDIPLSFSNPQTPISIARENFACNPTIHEADLLVADTFVFFDAPAVKKAAIRLGYDTFVYPDVFSGGESAAEELLGEKVENLEGIDQEYDLKRQRVPVHWTYRPLFPDDVELVWQIPSTEILSKKQ